MPQSTALQESTDRAVPAAASLTELVRKHADEAERSRRLGAPAVAALRESGLFHLFVPAEAGGLESDLVSAARAVSLVSKADGSTGWCSMIASQWAWYAAFLPPEGAAEVLDGSRASIAGQLRATGGTAEAVPGGYRVSGQWPFASGCHHAEWLAARCSEVREGEALPAPIVAFIRANDVTLLDTWHTSGLRGTGSDDFVVDDVFVPECRVFRLFPPPPSAFASKLFPAGAYSLPLVTQAGNALGIAEAACKSFQEVAQTHGRTGSSSTLADSQSSRVGYSETVVTIRSARSFLEAACAAYETSLERGPAGVDERIDLRLAITHAIRSAARAVNSLHEMAGATTVYAASPLDRQWRDINAAAAHVQASPRAFEVAGEAMLAPEKRDAMMAPYPTGVS